MNIDNTDEQYRADAVRFRMLEADMCAAGLSFHIRHKSIPEMSQRYVVSIRGTEVGSIWDMRGGAWRSFHDTTNYRFRIEAALSLSAVRNLKMEVDYVARRA